MTIIIADDHTQMREIIKKIVTGGNDFYRIIECEDGADAFTAAVNNNPDLIIMDLLMKGMDGFTAIKKIRNINKDVPIIVVTQFQERDFKEEVIKLGANAFVNKDSLLSLPGTIAALLNKTNK